MSDVKINKPKPIQIQVKDKDGSRSLTLYDITKDEAFNRILFLFESLAKNENEVKIICYKKGLCIENNTGEKKNEKTTKRR